MIIDISKKCCTFAPLFETENVFRYEFWTRVTPDSKDYIFVGVPSPKDCVVEPVDPSYTKTEPDPKDPTLPDYNIHYEF